MKLTLKILTRKQCEIAASLTIILGLWAGVAVLGFTVQYFLGVGTLFIFIFLMGLGSLITDILDLTLQIWRS